MSGHRGGSAIRTKLDGRVRRGQRVHAGARDTGIGGQVTRDRQAELSVDARNVAGDGRPRVTRRHPPVAAYAARVVNR